MSTREEAKEYINIELGDTITNMSFVEIAEAVQEKFDLDAEEVADILTTDMALDFSDDDSYRYELDIRTCPECGKEFKRSEMRFTRDCHGITFRLVCCNCYEKLMEKGFDGEAYDEADENIDYDY